MQAPDIIAWLAAADPFWPSVAGGVVSVMVALFVAMRVAGLWLRRRHRIGRRLGSSLEVLTTRLDPDALEGMPPLLSRAGFDQALDSAVLLCDRGGRSLSLLFIGLDNLQAINDANGQACGDRVIVRAAQMLKDLGGPAGGLTRVGGEAFLLMADADQNAARVLAALWQARLGSADLADSAEPHLSVSIGIANYPLHGSRARVVGHANLAMRQVRRCGGGDYAVFDPAMAIDLKDQAELLRDLRQAVARQQFELVYQPKIDARSLQITAAEALLRWHHPQRGLISPAIFIPLAERSGLIGPIGNWVIGEACRQAGVWRKNGLHMRVAINVSAYQMRQDDLVDRLQAALRENELSANRFTCEITESVAMEDTQVTQRSFERMRRAGLHVSIDDFGVGQTSLSYLRRLPAAELKIDASFVQDLSLSADARAIVEAVIKLAHALQLRVVAEGVETEAQRDLLVQMGCDELQGLLFARPMSARALSLWATDDGPEAATGFRASLFRDTQPAEL